MSKKWCFEICYSCDKACQFSIISLMKLREKKLKKNNSSDQDTFHNMTITMTITSFIKAIAEADLGLLQHSRWSAL